MVEQAGHSKANRILNEHAEPRISIRLAKRPLFGRSGRQPNDVYVLRAQIARVGAAPDRRRAKGCRSIGWLHACA